MAAKKRKRRKKNDDSMTKLIIVTITTFVATVMIFATGIALITSNNKKVSNQTPSASSLPVQSDIIVGFDDNDDDCFSSDEELSSDEISSEEVSSTIEHAAFEGTWKKTEVYESDKATLVISEQNDDGFSFKLTIWSNGKSQSISGTAAFTKKSTAVYTKKKASITFERGTKFISIYHSGNNDTLGLGSTYVIDGKFTTGKPSYYKQEEAVSYDADVYKSKAVANAIKSKLSANDYDLYNRMITEGLKSPIAYERTVDKNGNKINVDAELNCVKYYATLSDLGEDMILICANNGMFYLVLYNSSEMIYYTNDAAYSKKMPKSFQAVADSMGIKPAYK